MNNSELTSLNLYQFQISQVQRLSDQIPKGADFLLELKKLRKSLHLEGFGSSWHLVDLENLIRGMVFYLLTDL